MSVTVGELNPNKVILLVEDSKADVRLIQEVFKTSTVEHQLMIVRDGVAAMDYLYQRGDYENQPRPHLVVLDLNLPKKDGREVLAEIKADPNLRRIPVVVLTTSSHEEDVNESYKLQVNCYLTKSRNLQDYFKLVQKIESFWLQSVVLPGGE